MFGKVRLLDVGTRDGLLRGECGPYHWEVRLTRGPVSYGLDPVTLYKGRGRIARLVLYAPIPGTRLLRKVAAFDRGWLFGRRRYLAVVQRVVGYVESL
ncbi:MAG: hypothetical protein AB2385_12220 [Symbiobacterium sp.]|uniref:hypothetical protein n=1 Tax=Symbiobacterium sp. TaxID=1971213 RepID=UPI003464D203